MASVRPPLADRFDLRPHPEGGWYRETFRSTTTIKPLGYGGERPAATAIYYLLHPGEESAWHVVKSDEIWFFHSGGPLTLRLGGAGDRPGAVTSVTLGVGPDEQPQVLVPAGVWQAAAPATAQPVLVSCVVSPGFDFADFRLATGEPTDSTQQIPPSGRRPVSRETAPHEIPKRNGICQDR